MIRFVSIRFGSSTSTATFISYIVYCSLLSMLTCVSDRVSVLSRLRQVELFKNIYSQSYTIWKHRCVPSQCREFCVRGNSFLDINILNFTPIQFEYSVFKMLSEVDVFISNYTLVDPEMYQLWVDGHSSSDAVNILHQRGICHQTNASIELVASDILDHYRTYALLEKLLHTPTKLASEQLAFQIEPQTSQMLIEMYYEFDDIVIRELLGKKLTSKSRKDMDEVSEKTGITLKSCRRQYDNVKRVFKVVEDLPGSLAANIEQHFLLSEDLAKRYAAVVFIACLRFEMNKRKLQFLTFPDLYHCANSMMSLWTYRCVGSEYFDTDLDREFLLELAECRILLENDKHHKHLVCIKLKPMLLERSYQEVDSNFRSYSRAILGIGCNLHRSRDLRFFFLELVERCVEPWRQINWTHTDLRNFLTIYTQCALDMDVLRDSELRDAFERYMIVVTCCLLRMYHT